MKILYLCSLSLLLVSFAYPQNSAPTAVLTLNKTEFVFGDTIYVDYSGSFDPGGNTLQYQLIGDGNFVLDEQSKTAYFIPSSNVLGSTEIVLTVSNQTLADTAYASVSISPKLFNVSITSSFVDSDWSYSNYPDNHISGQLFIKDGKTFYAPLLSGLRRYEITDNTIVMAEEKNTIKSTGIFCIKDNLLFSADENISNFFGTLGYLTIYDISGGNKLLTKYLPGTSDIRKFIEVGNEIYLLDNYNYFYKIDFTDPSNPAIISKTRIDDADYYTSSFWRYDNEYFYLITRGSSNYFIKKVSRSDIKQISSIESSITSDNYILSSENTLLIYKYNSEILNFYQMDSNDNLFLNKMISASEICPNPFPGYLSGENLYWNYNLFDNYLEISGYNNLISRFFDISDLNNIKLVGYWYGGKVQLAKTKSDFYAVGDDIRTAYTSNIFSGINKIALSGITEVAAENINIIPNEYSLMQNYPNPFNPETIIKFSLPSEGHVTLKVYNSLGQELTTLVNSYKEAGIHSVNFNAGKLSAGTYFYRLIAGGNSITKKMVYLK